MKADDPNVAKARPNTSRTSVTPDKTYVVALQTMVFAEAQSPGDIPAIQRNVEWFKKNAIYKDGKLEGWSYPANQIADNSNTQYALLGLYAAKTAGVKIDDKLWKRRSGLLHAHTARRQNQPQRRLLDVPQRRRQNTEFHDDRRRCERAFTSPTWALIRANSSWTRKPESRPDAVSMPRTPALAKGMYWIGMQFNLTEGKSYFYNFYGIERLGRLSGQAASSASSTGTAKAAKN